MIANEHRNVAMRYLSGLQAYLEWARNETNNHPCGSCYWISTYGPDRSTDVLDRTGGYEGWYALHNGHFGTRAKELAEAVMKPLCHEPGNTFLRRLYVRNMIHALREELAEPCHA